LRVPEFQPLFSTRHPYQRIALSCLQQKSGWNGIRIRGHPHGNQAASQAWFDAIVPASSSSSARETAHARESLRIRCVRAVARVGAWQILLLLEDGNTD